MASKDIHTTPGVLKDLMNVTMPFIKDAKINGGMISDGMIHLSTPRRTGRSSVMGDLMIPGYSSEEAGRFVGGHEAYVNDLLAKQGKAPKYTIKPVANLFRQYSHTPLTPNQMEDYMEAPAGTDMDAQLADLVAQYGDAFALSPQNFSLTAPMKLITKKGKEYRNTSFIGGEEFVPASAYVGKKGQTLITLRPVDPSDFEFLEVPEKQCPKVFGPAFAAYLRETLDDILEKKDELVTQVSRQNEIARNAQAMEQYDGFGSW